MNNPSMSSQKRIIYKYSNLESAIKILKTSSVVLNQPRDFNDPFDSKFHISDESKKRTEDLLCNYFTFLELYKALYKTKAKFFDKKFELCSKMVVDKEVDILKEKGLFEYQDFFAKAFKENLSKNFKLKSKVTNGFEIFEKRTIPELMSYRDEARISCFSKRNDSILMWSHYADSHRGVCIEFEENRHFFSDVSYSEKRPEFDLYQSVQRRAAYDFFKQKLEMNDGIFREIALKPFYTKSSDWSYEQEVRCVLSNHEPSINDIDYDGENMLLRMTIKKIYIGCHAYGESLDKLLLAAKNRNIPVIFMKEDEKEFKIVPDPEKKAAVAIPQYVEKNSVEQLCHEIEISIANNCFYSAFSAALQLPLFMGKATYPDLNPKEAYIKWYDEMIGQYETSKDRPMPYLNGEACWAVRHSLFNDGKACARGQFGSVFLTQAIFKIEQKHPFNLYVGSSVTGPDPSKKSEIEVSIRDFCFKVGTLSTKCMKNDSTISERLPHLSFQRDDIMEEEMQESLARYQAFVEKTLSGNN